jgi:cbb3-type cytochrome oxidase maturation protein
MSIIFFTVPIALLLAIIFVVIFAIAAKGGQFDDLQTPAHKMLLDDEPTEDQKNIEERKN